MPPAHHLLKWTFKTMFHTLAMARKTEKGIPVKIALMTHLK